MEQRRQHVTGASRGPAVGVTWAWHGRAVGCSFSPRGDVTAASPAERRPAHSPQVWRVGAVGIHQHQPPMRPAWARTVQRVPCVSWLPPRAPPSARPCPHARLPACPHVCPRAQHAAVGLATRRLSSLSRCTVPAAHGGRGLEASLACTPGCPHVAPINRPGLAIHRTVRLFKAHPTTGTSTRPQRLIPASTTGFPVLLGATSHETTLLLAEPV